MPNLYFWEPESRSHGILQAVLPWDVCQRVVNRKLATHIGDEFPTGSPNGAGREALVILYVRPEEANDNWFPGFYRIDSNVMEIRKALLVPPRTHKEA
jgi:hypothetical protein